MSLPPWTLQVWERTSKMSPSCSQIPICPQSPRCHLQGRGALLPWAALSTFSMKDFPPTANVNLPWSNLRLLPLVPWEQNLTPTSSPVWIAAQPSFGNSMAGGRDLWEQHTWTAPDSTQQAAGRILDFTFIYFLPSGSPTLTETTGIPPPPPWQ